MFQMIAKNKIVIGGLAIFVAAGAWYALRGEGSSSELLVTKDFTVSGNESEKDLVATLLQLRSVALQGSIFSDPAFKSLQDFGSQIIPEPVGRVNPFAPLGGFSNQPTTTPSQKQPGSPPGPPPPR